MAGCLKCRRGRYATKQSKRRRPSLGARDVHSKAAALEVAVIRLVIRHSVSPCAFLRRYLGYAIPWVAFFIFIYF